jgi:hypothetical protein
VKRPGRPVGDVEAREHRRHQGAALAHRQARPKARGEVPAVDHQQRHEADDRRPEQRQPVASQQREYAGRVRVGRVEQREAEGAAHREPGEHLHEDGDADGHRRRADPVRSRHAHGGQADLAGHVPAELRVEVEHEPGQGPRPAPCHRPEQREPAEPLGEGADHQGKQRGGDERRGDRERAGLPARRQVPGGEDDEDRTDTDHQRPQGALQAPRPGRRRRGARSPPAAALARSPPNPASTSRGQ